MKSSTLSLVQWDFTSFLLGGLLQRLSIQNACAFSSWPAVPFSGGGDQMTTGWTVIWFVQNLACPQLVAIQCIFFFVMVKLMVFYGRFWHSTQSRKVFSPPDSFPCGTAGDGTISPVIPMAQRLLASRDIPSQKKNMYISISLHNIRYMYMYII